MSDFKDFSKKAGAFASAAAGKAKDFAIFAAKKTKKAARITKLNMDISKEMDTIKNSYSELGALYYETYGENPDETLAELCGKITAAFAFIEAMEAEIEELKAADEDTVSEDADFESVVEETEAEAEPALKISLELEIETEPAIEEEPTAPEATPVAEEDTVEEDIFAEAIPEALFVV